MLSPAGPKLFLWRGAAVFDPDLHETVYPLLTEMLYAVALAFRGPVACRLVHWVLGLVLAANVTALARPSLGPGRGGRGRSPCSCRPSPTAWAPR